MPQTPVCGVLCIYTNWADVTHLWPYPTGKTKKGGGFRKDEKHSRKVKQRNHYEAS